jgi:AraC-like DNA-binding protein
MTTHHADPRMRSQTVGPTLVYVRERGGDPAALVRSMRLPADAEQAADVILPLSIVRAFYDAAELASRDPLLGIHLAERWQRGSFGLVEFCCRSAASLGHALRRLVRYVGLVNDLVSLTFEERDGEVVLHHEIVGHPGCVGRHGNEFFLTMFARCAEALTGRPLVPRRTWFAHPAPRDTAALHAIFGPRIEFAHTGNGLALDPRVLTLPVISADAPLLSVLEQQAEQALARVAPANDFLGELRGHIQTCLPSGAPELDAVARGMRTSARSLQRRLKLEGTTFQLQAEATRKALAELYLGDPKMPLGEVAFRLGYAEVSAFQKAFKRWTGITPGRARQECVARSSSSVGA